MTVNIHELVSCSAPDRRRREFRRGSSEQPSTARQMDVDARQGGGIPRPLRLQRRLKTAEPYGPRPLSNQLSEARHKINRINPDVPGPYARRRVLLTAASLTAAGGVLSASARAAQLVEVGVRPLADAYRASKVIGANTVNDKNEKSASVDDLIITQKDRVL
jgi:hypothetical protein